MVWDEAENRLHVQKALMEYLLLGKLNHLSHNSDERNQKEIQASIGHELHRPESEESAAILMSK